MQTTVWLQDDYDKGEMVILPVNTKTGIPTDMPTANCCNKKLPVEIIEKGERKNDYTRYVVVIRNELYNNSSNTNNNLMYNNKYNGGSRKSKQGRTVKRSKRSKKSKRSKSLQNVRIGVLR